MWVGIQRTFHDVANLIPDHSVTQNFMARKPFSSVFLKF